MTRRRSSKFARFQVTRSFDGNDISCDHCIPFEIRIAFCKKQRSKNLFGVLFCLKKRRTYSCTFSLFASRNLKFFQQLLVAVCKEGLINLNRVIAVTMRRLRRSAQRTSLTNISSSRHVTSRTWTCIVNAKLFI